MIQPSLVRQVPAALGLPSLSIINSIVESLTPAFLSLMISSMVSAFAGVKDNTDQIKPTSVKVFIFFSFPKRSKAPNEVEALRFTLLIFPVPDLDFLRFYRVAKIFRIETIFPPVGGLRLGIHQEA